MSDSRREEKAPRELGGCRGADAGGRDLYTDTHCNTEGYPGSFRPIRMPARKERPITGAGLTGILAVALFAFTWCACYLAGCIA